MCYRNCPYENRNGECTYTPKSKSPYSKYPPDAHCEEEVEEEEEEPDDENYERIVGLVDRINALTSEINRRAA